MSEASVNPGDIIVVLNHLRHNHISIQLQKKHEEVKEVPDEPKIQQPLQ
jgi:hypothetical protein